MEPVTHLLTGACLSRTGFNRRAAYATLTMALAAEMPDIDTVWSWFGPVEGFAHHRGITHTFVALPAEAAVLVGAIYCLHRWRRARSSKQRIGPDYSVKSFTRAPVRWGALYGCALVGLLSHLLLDYTNNYGLRPFYPFNAHWYAASIAFIFDPVIFLLLASALVLPSLFGLVSAEVGAKARPFRGRGLAIAALLCICAWWGLRLVEHQKAVALGMQQTYDQQQLPVDIAVPVAISQPVTSVPSTDASNAATSLASPETELVQPPPQLLAAQRVQASPNPIDPFRWAVTIDYGPLYQMADIDARTGAVKFSDVTYPKLPADAVIRAAEASPLGRVYLDWSSMPIVTEDAPEPGSTGKLTRKIILRDPRFMGDISWLRLSQATPLTAVVMVNDSGTMLRQTFDGRHEPPGRGPIYEAHLTWPEGLFKSSSAPDTAPDSAATPTPKQAPVKPAIQHTAVLPNLDLPLSHTAKVEPPHPLPPVPVALTPVAPTPVVAKHETPPPTSAKPEPVKVAALPPVMPTPAAARLQAPVQAISQPPAPAATKPQPTGPGALDRAYDGAKAKAVKFRNWLHWLANGD